MAPTALIKIQPDEKCPKCGDNRIASNYVVNDDVVERSCLNCSATWKRLPLDAT